MQSVKEADSARKTRVGRIDGSRFWALAIAAVVAICAAATVALDQKPTPRDPEARIYKDGTLVRVVDLGAASAASYTFSVGADPDAIEDGMGAGLYAGDGSEANTAEVENGRIRVVKASCKDKICVKQGWISAGSAPIACLPNAFVIEITGSGDSGGSGNSENPENSDNSDNSDEYGETNTGNALGALDAVSR